MRGDLVAAVRLSDEALALVERLDPSLISRSIQVHRAVILLEAGEPQRCIDELMALGAPDFSLIAPVWQEWWTAALARASLAVGDATGAERWADVSDAAAQRLGLPMSDAFAARAKALVALSRGDLDDAVATAIRSSARASQAGARVEAARSQIVAGRALAAGGRHGEAREHLAVAEVDLSACGALRVRDEAARELRALGVRPAARTRRAAGVDGVASLSGRELEVATLVAEGRTNREIAGALFLSEKTIEAHLTRVFGKHGVRSRAAVAAAVGRERT
jgi:DNA-binding NarL/FixJ family response regulator